MPRTLTLILLFLILTASCTRNSKPIPEPDYNPHLHKPGDYIVTKGEIISLDSMTMSQNAKAKGKYIEVKELKLIPAKSNYHLLEKPKYIPASGKKMDLDTLAPPDTLFLQPHDLPYDWPERKPAQLYMRRDGQYNLSYLNIENGLVSGFIWELFEDSRGWIWIGTADGVSIWDGNGLLHFFEAYIYAIQEDQAGNIWLGGGDGRIYIWDGQKFTYYQVSNYPIRDLLVDSAGRIWIATLGEEGLIMWDGRVFKEYTQKQGFRGRIIRCFVEDQEGRIWIGTRGNGLNVWDENGFTHFTQKEGLKNNNILSLMVDKAGRVWIGHWDDSTKEGGGLSVWDGKGFLIYDKHGAISNSSVWGIVEQENGKVWVAGNGIGVQVLDDQGSRRYSDEEGLSDNFARVLLKDRNGHIWVSTANGITVFNRYSLNHLRESSLKGRIIWNLMEDKSGRVWIGTDGGGINVWDGDKFAQYTHQEYMVRFNVNSILKDDENQIWFSGLIDKRLSLWNGSEFRHFPKYRDKVSSFIWGMGKDHSGKVWLGHNGEGVSIWDGKGFSHFTEDNGLSNNFVRYLLPDKEQNMWVGTHFGLNRLHWNEEKGEMEVLQFLNSDGLMGRSQIMSMMLDQKNTLWLGTNKGVSHLDLNTVKKDTISPILSIRNLNLFFNFIDWRQLKDSLEKGRNPLLDKPNLPLAKVRYDSVYPFSNMPVDPIFPYNYNNLTFSWSAAHSSPHKLQYSYLLEGSDLSWSALIEENKITFPDLSPGNYIFKIKAVGDNGVWSKTIAYSLQILPPWWANKWAYILYGLIVLGIFFGIRRYEIGRLNSKNEALRLKELDSAKTKLYTNITHEFRTPLTVITGMAEQIEVAPQKWAEKGSKMIRRNSQNLLRLVNQMLDLRKLESGSMKLNMIQADVIPYLKYLIESFHSYAESKDIRVHFMSDIDECVMDYDPEKLQQIVSNLMSNAIKFTKRGGDVYLIVDKGEGRGSKVEEVSGTSIAPSSQLSLKVKDTGTGIPKEKISNIFDRFYQVDDSATREGDHLRWTSSEIREGTGIGLSLTKALVQMLGGHISVRSNADPSTGATGSEFTVQLPVTNQAPAMDTPLKNSNLTSVSAPFMAVAQKAVTALGKEELPLALIVEDNADVIQYLIACLENSYQTEVAKDGKEGIDKALELTPDIIISDVMMPRKDGFQLTEKLKTDIRTSHIPIILLTAKADVESKIKGLQRGADAYLPKPFNRQELMVRMQKLLELRQHLRKHYLSLVGGIIPPTSINETLNEEVMEHRFLQKARQVVLDNLDNFEFKVTDLHEELNMSHSNLHRKLKFLTGLSANEFIHHVRLQKAKHLLIHTDEPISNIAYDLGYKVPSHFSKVFKKEIGMSPSEFREKGGN